MVQTGFRAEAHCWKCFKENVDMSVLDGKPMNLCKGCLYVVKQFSSWLNAYGLGVREIPTPIPLAIVADQNLEDGIEGVEGGGNPPGNTKGRNKP